MHVACVIIIITFPFLFFSIPNKMTIAKQQKGTRGITPSLKKKKKSLDWLC